MDANRNYHIERAPQGQAGWFVRDQEGNTLGWFEDQAKAGEAIQEMVSRAPFAPPDDGGLVAEPSQFLG